jgi:asparagine synthase (glutamine-hydrolysing)
MCGIAGIVSLKNKVVEKHLLQSMTDSIIHRGPDGEGFWFNNDETIGFGHRRLAILDLSENGKQPMKYHHLTITFNGELYNYIELREVLVKKGHVFESQTDTEVILAAYLEYGEDCLKHFDGMFAFAIWDENKKEIFAARDRFGEKPFYYYFDGKQLVFASEMKAIFSAGIPKIVADKMIYLYLSYDVVEDPNDKSSTFFKNVNQLPASHWLKIDAQGELELKKYWAIDLSKKTDIKIEEAQERFKDLLDDSVKKRMRSDVAVGTSLSGGLDSSTIVGSILTQFKDVGLNTFTARFDDINYDEGDFVDLMNDKFSFNSNFCWPKEDLLITELEKIFYHQEEPFGSTSIVAQWEVMKLAKKKNVTVLLDGQGADETIAGYYKYFTPFLSELYRTDRGMFESELEAINSNLALKDVIPNRFKMESNFPKMMKYLGDFTRKYRISKIAPDISKEFLDEFKNEPSPYNRLSSLNEFLHFDCFNYGLGKLLRFSDRNAMAHSREVRLPYLSHELVEFVFSLPSQYKMHMGWSKYILRKSMEEVLPKEIVWRKDKKGFQAPQSWMSDGRVQDLIKESQAKIVKAGIIDKPLESNSWKYIMVNKLLG